MSAFYVGQQIKKVRGGFNVGLTGTYVGANHNDLYPEIDCLVRANATADRRIDGGDGPSIGAVSAGSVGPARSADWEPIIPPGLESLDEINALYEPEPMRVSESEAFALELYVAGLCHEGCK